MRKLIPLAIALTFALTSCTAPSEQVTQPANEPEVVSSEACLSAFEVADGQARAHYDSGPMAVYTQDAPDLPETDEEWAAWEEAVAADETAFASILAPLYTDCANIDQFVEGARAFPFVVGLSGAEFVDQNTLQGYCYEKETTPACTDWEEFSF